MRIGGHVYRCVEIRIIKRHHGQILILTHISRICCHIADASNLIICIGYPILLCLKPSYMICITGYRTFIWEASDLTGYDSTTIKSPTVTNRSGTTSRNKTVKIVIETYRNPETVVLISINRKRHGHGAIVERRTKIALTSHFERLRSRIYVTIGLKGIHALRIS